MLLTRFGTRWLPLALACAFAALPAAASAASRRTPQGTEDVLTYHGDAQRSGWNANETQLTTANVNATSFGLLAIIPLDGRVDAQPLIATQQPIDGQGTHDVVYVATENDTLFALDAESGATLWSTTFGTPVPDSWKDGDDNVFPVMGILGTPVIDRTLGAIFVVADTFYGSYDQFTLHAVALSNGTDLVAPVPIAFSGALKNGSTWTFNAKYQLQRAGLLEANSSIYVTFGSNGDIDPQASRGTIVRYDAATLAPLAGGITDRLVQKKQPFYLSSIWQSGYAPAVDTSGNLYFATGNSNPSKESYNTNYNPPESVVKISGDLSQMLSGFTPSNYFSLDQGDADTGSGGTMVLPPQSGAYPNLIVAGGKDGRLWLLNAADLGGYHKDRNTVLAQASMGGCWCGPSNYVGADGIERVLSGGGNGVTAWKVLTGRGKPSLALESSTGPYAVNGLPDDGGAIATVSSNGSSAGSAIAWFVQRPQTSSDEEPGTPVVLRAYDASNLATQLFSTQAGTWRHAVNSNANIVPTVANGFVYVASEKQLQIFGLLPQARRGGKHGHV